ncbi:S24 family peptidase [Duncaniella freteri]|jgi:phage repressor protein C with HTH and peptisase S24 domain|uniref:S24 family peptidase n=1 Tax=Duncaniella freteri TaxID=2530391 RepID=UPI00258CB713|nr:S24 family peptidase [Duncaniella freteri]
MSKILSRIQEIASREGITIGAMERMIGASKGVLSRAIANGTDIQSKWLMSIVENYPKYSGDWLLTGQGDMLKGEKSQQNTTIPIIQQEISESTATEEVPSLSLAQMRPRIPLEAAAGSLSIMTQSVSDSDCEMQPIIKRLPEYDFTIMVKGDSMEPNFKSGDELACRMVRESSFIQWGQPHIVDSYDGIVLKRIHNSGDNILCTSDNPRYGEFPIPKKDIYRLALVVGLIRQF